MTTGKISRNTPGRMDLPFVGLATFAAATTRSRWRPLRRYAIHFPRTRQVTQMTWLARQGPQPRRNHSSNSFNTQPKERLNEQ
jgi:hypothetical protein